MDSTPPTAARSTPPVPPTPAVGFAGLGRMGLPLAQRLLQSGIPMVVYNRTQSKAESLVPAGARWAASPRDLAKAIGKGVTFLMLTDGTAVRSVLFGRGGFARAATDGALVVDLSTIDPEESRANAAKLRERGVHYVDAPVGGSVDAATRGDLTVFVGGDTADVSRVRPLLERVGRRIDHMGPVGAGTSSKLVNNLLTVGITALSSEALTLADAFHLDRPQILEVLQAGGGRSGMLESKSPSFLARQYPAQFTTVLARKDLRLIERAASREGRVLKMTREARRLYDEAIAQGHADEDFASVLEVALSRGRTGTPKPLPGPAIPSSGPPEDGGPAPN